MRRPTLRKELSGHFVKTVPQMKWATIKNGELLALAEKESDVFITVDGISLSSRICLNSTLQFWFYKRIQIG
jgi:hypothetical protein